MNIFYPIGISIFFTSASGLAAGLPIGLITALLKAEDC